MIIPIAIVAAVLILLGIMMYRVVEPSEAHLIVGPFKKMVCAADDSVRVDKEGNSLPGGSWYFQIPVVRTRRIMDLTIKEIKVSQTTREVNMARYQVSSSLKYRIKNVDLAANTFTTDQELQDQLKEVIFANVRDVTIKREVVDVMSNKKEISRAITAEMLDDLNKWGLELVNFQLINFQDVVENGETVSEIISDISKRREVEIAARTREENAEKKKQARVKEAKAEEIAKQSEIEKDEKIGMRDQNRKQRIAEQD